ncbi:MAG TPA: hypothetical protein VE777_03875 [Gaiellales bacterium]|jgi:hypothetical protein|nr:hypothetical protein [Gaiellales bacterium]
MRGIARWASSSICVLEARALFSGGGGESYGVSRDAGRPAGAGGVPAGPGCWVT